MRNEQPTANENLKKSQTENDLANLDLIITDAIAAGCDVAITLGATRIFVRWSEVKLGKSAPPWTI